MIISKKLWLNYVATQLSVKDKTFGHLLISNIRQRTVKKELSTGRLKTKSKKSRIICKLKVQSKTSSNLKSGSVLILLSKKLLGKKVVLLNTTESGLYVITGPFSINGVPLRRVNYKYTIFSGASLDLEKLNTSVLNDDYFETLRKSKNKKSQSKNFNSVLSHRIRQNFIDKYLTDSLKKNFFLKAYLRTNKPSLVNI